MPGFAHVDPTQLLLNRATERNRTADLLITNQLLYQLSYCGLTTYTRDRKWLREGES
jgi:hypothetical protein